MARTLLGAPADLVQRTLDDDEGYDALLDRLSAAEDDR